MKKYIFLFVFVSVSLFLFSCCQDAEMVQLSEEIKTKIENLSPGDKFYIDNWQTEAYKECLEITIYEKMQDAMVYELNLALYDEDKIGPVERIWLIKTDSYDQIQQITYLKD